MATLRELIIKISANSRKRRLSTVWQILKFLRE
ncbi:truncated transposase [Escherichia coli]|nr:truncated transposase [Escherichia coli]CUA48815.1 truncated transposase [Escherichia coli]